MSQVVTMGAKAFDMHPGSIIEGVNGDFMPPWRLRFVRGLWRTLCWVLGHRWVTLLSEWMSI